MAKTIVAPSTAEELSSIRAGKNFLLFYTKVVPQEGQPLILQTADDEEHLKIESVTSSPGLIKHWYLLAWNVQVLNLGPSTERQEA